MDLDILRQNSFRILGLPGNASTKDIHKREEELLVYLNFGKKLYYAFDHIDLLGPIERTRESIANAIHIINDSEKRLLHSLFWFWYKEDNASLYLNKLLEDPGRNIEAIDDFYLLKNWSVYYLILSIVKKRQFNKFVSLSLACFKQLSYNNEFYDILWQQFTGNQIRISGDELIEVFVENYYSLIENRIIQYIDQSKLKPLQQFINFLKKQNLPQNTTHFVEKNIAQLIENKIEQLIKEAELDIEIDEDYFKEITENFIKEVNPYLKFLESILSTESYTFQTLSDKVAEHLLSSAIKYVNDTGDFKNVYEIIIQTKKLAFNPMLIDRIERNLKIVKKNIEELEVLEKCWFCGEKVDTDKYFLKLPMYKITEVTYSGVKYKTIKIPIPRCYNCYKKYVVSRRVTNFFIFLILLVLFGIGWLSYYDNLNGFAYGLIPGIIISYIVTSIFVPEIPSDYYASEAQKTSLEIKPFSMFPIVKKLLSDNWRFGFGPSEAETQHYVNKDNLINEIIALWNNSDDKKDFN